MGTEPKTVYYREVVIIMMYVELKEKLKSLEVPPFVIICSQSPIANKEMAYYLAKKDYLGMNIVIGDNKVDTVREIISMAYTQTIPTYYIFLDADSMSISAKNALLKVTEEPPKNVHFVLCISNMANTLATLRSRAYTLQLRPLTVREVKEILDKKYPNATDSERQIAIRICTTYEQVQDLFKQDVEELVEFVEKVVDNVASVTVTNALKILLSLKFKEDDKGKYNPILFLNLYAETLTDRFLDEYISVDEYQNAMNSVLELRTELRVNAINSKNLFELWLLEQWQILGGEDIE